MRTFSLRIAAALTAIAGALGAPAVAAAQWTGTYFQMPVVGALSNPDVQQGIDFWIVSGLVQTQLGPNGMPVRTGASGASPINDVNAAGELQWWSGNGTMSLPDLLGGTSNVRVDAAIDFPTGFYPTGMTGNADYMRAAHWTSRSLTSGSYFMGLTADDDAWLFVNGQLALDNGGVKGIGAWTTGWVDVQAGDRLDVFFADRNTVESGIQLYQGGLGTTTAPEPASLVLTASGLLAVGAAARRRRRSAVA